MTPEERQWELDVWSWEVRELERVARVVTPSESDHRRLAYAHAKVAALEAQTDGH